MDDETRANLNVISARVTDLEDRFNRLTAELIENHAGSVEIIKSLAGEIMELYPYEPKVEKEKSSLLHYREGAILALDYLEGSHRAEVWELITKGDTRWITEQSNPQ